MLTSEEGPFNIFVRLREAAGISHTDNFPIWKSGNILACLWCTSVWVAIGVLMLPKSVVRVFALSAIAVLVDKNSK